MRGILGSWWGKTELGRVRQGPTGNKIEALKKREKRKADDLLKKYNDDMAEEKKKADDLLKKHKDDMAEEKKKANDLLKKRRKY